ncbi:hypothetical protein [Pseudomonas entomophila]|uniref:Uncharacterized protein n=2 Tax=Pseudomonas entomophila TaxID=312306 RepID=Q1I7H2_PSEE4|nr:hypothetical protein [Pseudomonas entomophila]WMW07835.1 hypothetical protein RAH46_10995 [Pseudomonas entomophila]CAK16410.1 hypothetical protein PSEEN3686 [Pseudomonas entomophila L48]
MDVRLTGVQRDQSSITLIGDGDNSPSMRSTKLGAYGSILYISAAGERSHATVIQGGNGFGVKLGRPRRLAVATGCLGDTAL